MRLTPRRRRFLPMLAALLVVGLLICARTAAVAAHAALETSDPAANAVLATPPPLIVMRFTEPLEPTESTAVLQDASGEEIAGARSEVAATDPFVMSLSVPADIADGTYVVSWRTLSTADGHPFEGFFAITIGAQAPAESITLTESTTTGGPPYWLITLVKWLTYLGLALTVASWPVWLAVISPALRITGVDDGMARRRHLGLTFAGMALIGVGSVGALIVQGWLASSERSLADRTLSVLTDTRYGEIWTRRLLALLLVVAISIVAVSRNRRSLGWLVAALALLIPLTFSQISHASAHQSGRDAAVVADWLHLSAAMLWSGGLAYLILLVLTLRPVPGEVLRVAIPRFSAIALGAWTVLALTGAYGAWLLVGSRDALTDTSYGKTLIAKLAILVPVLALAAINLLIFSLRFRRGEVHGSSGFRRSVTIEAMLVVAVLLTVGWLVGLQPAVDSVQATAPIGIEQQLDLSGHAGELLISPGTPGPNTYTLSVSDAPDDPTVEALLRMTPPGEQTALNEIDLVRQADGSFSGDGAELGLVGDWTITVLVRQIGQFQWQATTPVLLGTNVSADARLPSGWRFDGIGAAGMVMLALAVASAVGAVLTVGKLRSMSMAASVSAGIIGVLLIGIGKL